MKLLSLVLFLTPVLLGQPPDGWIQLFDGETQFGWTADGGKWRVADGALAAEDGQSGWLRNNNVFADYVLQCEVRVPRGAAGAIRLRDGYEVPIKSAKPGEWQTCEIEATGDRVVVKLNGKKTFDRRDLKSSAGHIELRAGAEFRNIKLKPLGMKSIFNGKDLSGWREVKATRPPAQPPEWSVKDGAIHVEKGPGQLETEGVYGDFILQLDIRTNAQGPTHHPNSGVFLRGDPNGYWTGYESQIRNEYKDGDRTKPVDWGTGAIYNRIATRKVVSNDNEFFTKTIVASGKHLAVWLNGYPVTDWDDPRPEASSARQGARVAAGPISFQAHDPTTNLDFKNVRVVTLPSR